MTSDPISPARQAVVLSLDFAQEFAVRAHEGQLRKGGDVPYISHPLAVADRLWHIYRREDLAIAGLLHDVVEDTPITIGAISKLFGPYIAALVAAVTKVPGRGMALPVGVLSDQDRDVLRLKGADLYSNLVDTANDVDKGKYVWNRFASGRGKIEVWASEIALVGQLVKGPLAHHGDRETFYPLETLLVLVRGLANIVNDAERTWLLANEAAAG